MSDNLTTYQQVTNYSKAIARCAELERRVSSGERLDPKEQLELDNLRLFFSSFPSL